MIDVYAPADLFPAASDRQLAEELTSALLRAEGGWGIAGTAFGREEFAALAARKSATT
jgi:hypothetical protein